MSYRPRRMLMPVMAIIVAFAPLYVAGDDTGDISNPWNETDLDFSFIERRVTTESCGRSETRYLACIAALDAMLDLAPRKFELVLANWPLGSNGSGRPLARFGSLVVAEHAAPDNHRARNALEEVKARRQRILDWQAEYRRGRGEVADFDNALAWVFANVVEADRAKQYAAAAINGYIGVQDAHARIFPAPALSPRNQADTGSFAPELRDRKYTGLGVAVQQVADSIMVTGVIEGSPASAAGVRVGDVILAVNGEPLGDKSLPQVVTRLRGPAESQVTLALQRQNERRDISMRRGAVEVKNVTAELVEDSEYRWGHLRIRSFTVPNTCAEARRELRTLTASEVDGILLDLRDNMGGLIDQAVCMANLFLGPGLPVVEMRSLRNPQRSRTIRTRHPAMTRLPLVSLVNAGTGSASEVLLGALRDHGRSLVVGERTFGKGTMQRVRPWGNGSRIMKFYTAGVMYAPSGRSMQMSGIEPDLNAYDGPEGKSPERVVLREEDLFPMALPAVSDPPSESVEDQNGALVRLCVTLTGTADQRWSDAKRRRERMDYTFDVGQDTLRCLTKYPAQTVTAR